MVGVQIASLALGLGSAVSVVAIVHNTPNVCLTEKCASEASLATQIKDVASQSVQTAPDSPIINRDIPKPAATSISPAPVVMDPASVRAKILDQYNSFIASTNSYVQTQYPTLSGLHDQADAIGSKLLTEPADSPDWKIENSYTSLWQTYSKDINIRINNAITSDCDLNHIITTADEHQYCHDIFEKSVDTSNIKKGLVLFQK